MAGGAQQHRIRTYRANRQDAAACLRQRDLDRAAEWFKECIGPVIEADILLFSIQPDFTKRIVNLCSIFIVPIIQCNNIATDPGTFITQQPNARDLLLKNIRRPGCEIVCRHGTLKDIQSFRGEFGIIRTAGVNCPEIVTQEHKVIAC